MAYKVVLDSNTMTYLNESMEPWYDPAKDNSDLVKERVAILRIFLCNEHDLLILPVVRSEYEAIKDSIWKLSHEQLHFVHLSEQDIRNPENVAKLTERFYRLHRKEKDCRLLAEAIDSKADYLLTCDKDFTNRLTQILVEFRVKFIRPSVFWSTILHSGENCANRLEPHPTNPLSTKNWWRWLSKEQPVNEPLIKMHKTRREEEGGFCYDMNIKMVLTSLTGRSIPNQLKPKIDTIFQEISQELDDRVAKLFDDYEEEPVE